MNKEKRNFIIAVIISVLTPIIIISSVLIIRSVNLRGPKNAVEVFQLNKNYNLKRDKSFSLFLDETNNKFIYKYENLSKKRLNTLQEFCFVFSTSDYSNETITYYLEDFEVTYFDGTFPSLKEREGYSNNKFIEFYNSIDLYISYDKLGDVYKEILINCYYEIFTGIESAIFSN